MHKECSCSVRYAQQPKPHVCARYGHTAIIAMDAGALRRVRGKTRVLLTRFLARALLCPIFSQEWVDRRLKGTL